MFRRFFHFVLAAALFAAPLCCPVVGASTKAGSHTPKACCERCLPCDEPACPGGADERPQSPADSPLGRPCQCLSAGAVVQKQIDPPATVAESAIDSVVAPGPVFSIHRFYDSSLRQPHSDSGGGNVGRLLRALHGSLLC